MMHWLPIRSEKKFTDVSWCAPKSLLDPEDKVENVSYVMMHLWTSLEIWMGMITCVMMTHVIIPIQIWKEVSASWHMTHFQPSLLDPEDKVENVSYVMMHLWTSLEIWMGMITCVMMTHVIIPIQIWKEVHRCFMTYDASSTFSSGSRRQGWKCVICHDASVNFSWDLNGNDHMCHDDTCDHSHSDLEEKFTDVSWHMTHPQPSLLDPEDKVENVSYVMMHLWTSLEIWMGMITCVMMTHVIIPIQIWKEVHRCFMTYDASSTFSSGSRRQGWKCVICHDASVNFSWDLNGNDHMCHDDTCDHSHSDLKRSSQMFHDIWRILNLLFWIQKTRLKMCHMSWCICELLLRSEWEWSHVSWWHMWSFPFRSEKKFTDVSWHMTHPQPSLLDPEDKVENVSYVMMHLWTSLEIWMGMITCVMMTHVIIPIQIWKEVHRCFMTYDASSTFSSGSRRQGWKCVICHDASVNFSWDLNGNDHMCHDDTCDHSHSDLKRSSQMFHDIWRILNLLFWIQKTRLKMCHMSWCICELLLRSEWEWSHVSWWHMWSFPFRSEKKFTDVSWHMTHPQPSLLDPEDKVENVSYVMMHLWTSLEIWMGMITCVMMTHVIIPIQIWKEVHRCFMTYDASSTFSSGSRRQGWKCVICHDASVNFSSRSEWEWSHVSWWHMWSFPFRSEKKFTDVSWHMTHPQPSLLDPEDKVENVSYVMMHLWTSLEIWMGMITCVMMTHVIIPIQIWKEVHRCFMTYDASSTFSSGSRRQGWKCVICHDASVNFSWDLNGNDHMCHDDTCDHSHSDLKRSSQMFHDIWRILNLLFWIQKTRLKMCHMSWCICELLLRSEWEWSHVSWWHMWSFPFRSEKKFTDVSWCAPDTSLQIQKTRLKMCHMIMMHWLLLRSEKWSHVSWCTDFPFRSEWEVHRCFMMRILNHSSDLRRQGWKCVICHDDTFSTFSSEIWKMIQDVHHDASVNFPFRSEWEVHRCFMMRILNHSSDLRRQGWKCVIMSWWHIFNLLFWDLKNDSGCASWCICELPIRSEWEVHRCFMMRILNHSSDLKRRQVHHDNVSYVMMHWLLLRSEKWSHVSWCTDFPLDLKRSSQMFHDALLNLFRSRRQGWKCVICHDALTSLEIWKMITCVMMHWLPIRSEKKFTDVSWCAPKSLQIQKTRLKMCHMSWCTDFSWDLKNDHTYVMMHWLLLRSEKWSHICHDALTSLEIWKMVIKVSWCTDLSWDMTSNVHMCHDALTSVEMWNMFPNLSCRMHWLLLRSEKWSHICHDALSSLEISRMFTHVSWYTDFSWHLKNALTCVMMHFLLKFHECSHICHDALTSLEIWKMITHMSWCTDFSWDLKNDHTYVMMHWLLLRSEK